MSCHESSWIIKSGTFVYIAIEYLTLLRMHEKKASGIAVEVRHAGPRKETISIGKHRLCPTRSSE
jgi:hypothetical protein